MNDIFSVGSIYYVVSVEYSADPQPISKYNMLYGELPSLYLYSQPMHDDQDDPSYWHFYFLERTWSPDNENNILKLIADDEVENILFINFDRSTIYHPYDGGADVFLSSIEARDSKKKQYSDWLSTHPSEF